jgi:hypothetical protein
MRRGTSEEDCWHSLILVSCVRLAVRISNTTLDYIFVNRAKLEPVEGEQQTLDFRCVTNSFAPVSDHLGLYAQIKVL